MHRARCEEGGDEGLGYLKALLSTFGLAIEFVGSRNFMDARTKHCHGGNATFPLSMDGQPMHLPIRVVTALLPPHSPFAALLLSGCVCVVAPSTNACHFPVSAMHPLFHLYHPSPVSPPFPSLHFTISCSVRVHWRYSFHGCSCDCISYNSRMVCCVLIMSQRCTVGEFNL